MTKHLWQHKMKISIEGNIGSGKSTVISRLCQEKRMPVFLEPVDEWKEWLTLFYSDPTRWGLSFNLHVLLTFHRWINNEFPAVYERSPISNRHVFTQLGFEEGRLNELELQLFDAMFAKLAWVPDIVIYIRTDPSISMDRMQKRARDCECGVPIEYLQAIHEKHESIFHGKHDVTTILSGVTKHTKVFEVDGNMTHDDVYADVLRILTLSINTQ